MCNCFQLAISPLLMVYLPSVLPRIQYPVSISTGEELNRIAIMEILVFLIALFLCLIVLVLSSVAESLVKLAKLAEGK